jgi:hypothetical protein
MNQLLSLLAAIFTAFGRPWYELADLVDPDIDKED